MNEEWDNVFSDTGADPSAEPVGEAPEETPEEAAEEAPAPGTAANGPESLNTGWNAPDGTYPYRQPQQPQTAPQQPQTTAQPPYGYGTPAYSQSWGPYQPAWAGYAYPPRKKKMSTGLKVFLIVAAVMAGTAILGFLGYLGLQAVGGNRSYEDVLEEYAEDYGDLLPFDEFPFDELPGYGGRDREEGDGSGHGGSRRDGDLPFVVPDPEEPGGEETPDFGAEHPDSAEPLPEIDTDSSYTGITVEAEPSGEELSAQEVYQRVVRSTVTVAVSREVNGTEQTGTGTGIIASSDGYIITNSHVVLNSKSSRVKITTYDGAEYDAVVVGTDRSTDLAVLKTNDYGFVSAEFGDSDLLSIGDRVIAIGNPGGARFSGSMTGGYVSGLNRAVENYSENGMTYIQTDAAINPGNSGGPLVNMYGQVVGINSSKIITTGYEGMGFAIPMTQASRIINELIEGGYVQGRVRLGITGQDVTTTIYAYTGAPQGFLIVSINEDSAFAGTEAQVGDIITALDGETVSNLDEISNLLLKYSPGDRISVTLYRMEGNEELTVDITLLEDKGETQQ